MASWLSASWLLCFLASRLLGFRLLVGLCGFWWLFGFGFPHPLHSSSSPAGGVFGFCWFILLLVALAFRILCFPSSSPGFLAFAPFHRFLALASRILSITSSSLFESSLLRTSWGGLLFPTPPLLFRFLQRCNCTPFRIITSSNIMGGLPPPPPNPPATFWISCRDIIAPLFESSLFRASNFARTCCKIRHFMQSI